MVQKTIYIKTKGSNCQKTKKATFDHYKMRDANHFLRDATKIKQKILDEEKQSQYANATSDEQMFSDGHYLQFKLAGNLNL